jgi:hypothetical protein
MPHKNDILILIDRHDLNVYDLTQMSLLVVNFNIFRTPLKIAFLGCSARRTERRNPDSMGYTARLRVPCNDAMRPEKQFLEVSFIQHQ